MGSYSSVGTAVQFGNMKVLEMDGGDACTTIETYIMPLKYMLKNA